MFDGEYNALSRDDLKEMLLTHGILDTIKDQARKSSPGAREKVLMFWPNRSIVLVWKMF